MTIPRTMLETEPVVMVAMVPNATRAPVRERHRMLLEEHGRTLALEVESVSGHGPQ